MNRSELDRLIAMKCCKKDGTNAACLKVKDFIRNLDKSDERLLVSSSCVSTEEFIEAVKVLLAFANSNEDTIPERWHCDSDCRRVFSPWCPGECSIKKDSPNMCPHFIDDGDV